MTAPQEQSLQQALEKLAPNREHESNWLKALLCCVGAHRWYELDLADYAPGKKARLCRWCPAVEIARSDEGSAHG